MTKSNENINMDSTIAGSMNVRSKLTTSRGDMNSNTTIVVISHCAVDGIWAEPSNSITESESFSILCTA